MSDSCEQLKCISLWLISGPAVSSADYIHRLPTLSDPEVTENLRRNIEKQWNNHSVELSEDECHELINTLKASLLVD